MSSREPTGDCFEAAARFITQRPVLDWPDEWRLVHGNVASLRQEGAVNHAWIEEKGNDLVREVSNGRTDFFPKAAYYRRYGVTNVRTYAPTEALVHMVRYGLWGPWD